MLYIYIYIFIYQPDVISSILLSESLENQDNSSCKQDVMCQHWAGTGPMLEVLAKYWPSTGMFTGFYNQCVSISSTHFIKVLCYNDNEI